MKRIKVGILGATGMVGQRFVAILAEHPWFEIAVLAASPRSAGERYGTVVRDRWSLPSPCPGAVEDMTIMDVEGDKDRICDSVDMVFSAIDMDKAAVRALEEAYAFRGIAVVSNNAAHRWTDDVPMIIPEVNPEHTALIDIQRKRQGWKRGCIAVKPNCSIQSYVPALHALREFGLHTVEVTTLQAVSGAGKTLETWPEMQDNVIPLILSEEEKSEREPLKVWGTVTKDGLICAEHPIISATCIRVPVSNGHMASVAVSFKKRPTREDMLLAWREYKNPIASLDLPSAPAQVLVHCEEDDRPQTNGDRMREGGMAITIGRLRKDPILGWKFVCLSHNTIRGAAGGAVLLGELLVKKGYIDTTV